MIGSKLAHYEVTGHLGSGGMGDVYQATDSKLGRSVAIKLLPEAFARDAERVARFEREARLLASLNHSNIAVIHGLEQHAEGRHFLVMELVNGETLAERIQRGSIPIDEALGIAKQIAEALEAAHEKGIIHRDLKPANIKVTPDGKVKVLDFGLAKAFESEAPNANMSNSPTLSVAATNAGVILGTAAYMSPEQARGQKADKQSDVWAFGCVLYEVLTGRQVFFGETLTDVLGGVVKSDPEWSALPPSVPESLRSLLRRCLQKHRSSRLRDIADARIEIEEALANPTAPAAARQPAAPAKKRLERAIWAFAVLTLTAGLAATSVLYFSRPEPHEIRLQVNTPSTPDAVSLAISPDGQQLVFVGNNEGKTQLWVRPLDSLVSRPLAGTEGAAYPFWSPDSASVGFFAGGKLKRVDIAGGATQALASVATGLGGAWSREGVILYAPAAAGPLQKIAVSGAEPVPVTRLEPGQVNHRFPQFLPDGKHFIYFSLYSSPGIYIASLDSSESKRLTGADTAGVVTPSGFLLFVRQGVLFQQPIDLKKQELLGNPSPVAEQVIFDPSIYVGGFSATTGVAAYRTGSASARQLIWFDRSGKTIGAIGDPDSDGMGNAELSPSGRHVAVQRAVNGNTDIWLLDTARGVPTRFTFDPAIDAQPLWTPDGSRVVFNSARKVNFELYQKLSSGAGPDELLLQSDQVKSAQDWSPDGRFLLFRSVDSQTGYDLWALPTFGDKKPFPFVKTAFEEREGQFSPDGRWVAYQSNESGRFEIYVQAFPGPGGKFQISANGAAQPRWRSDGKELFYVSLESKMMAAPIKLSPDGQSVETGTPQTLFAARIALGALPGPFKQQYAVSPDGQRFLINAAAEESVASPINIIYNWKPKQ